MSIREAILAADDLPREPISLPEWGYPDGLFVRTMTGEERDQWEALTLLMNEDAGRKKGAAKAQAARNVRASLAVFVLVDTENARVFGEQDIQALGRKSSALLDRICDIAMRLNAIGPQAVKELEEGLKETPADSSTSSS